MDPRHPELAIPRMRELMKQYTRIEKEMKGATLSSKLGELEREGSLVIQEICLVAPRLHEAMMQTSRNRRYDLAHGVLDEPQDTAVEEPVFKKPDFSGRGVPVSLVEEPEPELVAPTIDSVVAISKEIDKFNEHSATHEVVEETTDKIEVVEEVPTPPNQAETVMAVLPAHPKRKKAKKAKK